MGYARSRHAGTLACADSGFDGGLAWRAVWALLVMPVWSATAHAAGVSGPLLGKWLGTVGSSREKIAVGLEFRRGADGKLTLLLTQPISNYFGADVGGEVRRDGDQVVHEGLAMTLRLTADKLEGTFPGPTSSAVFQRAKSLPSELAPPKVPSGPAPRWQTRLGGQVFASPVVFEGVAYVGSTGGVFNAVNTKDGTIAWTFSAGKPLLGEAAVSATAVYFVCDDGFLYKLNRADGKEIWRHALGDGQVSRVFPHPQASGWDWQGARPLLAEDTVYVGAGDGGFHAIDSETGAKRWRFVTRGKIRNGAALDGTRVVFGSGDHFVYSLERSTGREIWRFDTKAEVDAMPLVANGKVIVGNRGPGLYSLDAQTGVQDWRLYFWGSWVESTATLVDGVVYVGSSDLRRVSAIDPADGRVLWRSDVYGWTWGTPLVTPDRIYVGVAGGLPYFVHHVASFTTLERKSGRILTRWPFADTGGHQWGIAGSPALASEDVIVATIDGSLYAFPRR